MRKLRGVTYPLALNGAGGLSLSEDFDCIREQIVSIIETRPTERVMRQDYGMPDYPFTQTLPNVVAEYLRIAIKTYLPFLTRLTVTPIDSDLENGTLKIRIEYDVEDISQIPIEFNLSDTNG